MRYTLQTSALLAVLTLACGRPEPFEPAKVCHVEDEDGRELFDGLHLEEERSCSVLELHARDTRDLLIASGFTTQDEFVELFAHVQVWIHAGQEVTEGDVVEGKRASIGEYQTAHKTGSVPWVELERWHRAWSHELLHHVDVEKLGIDPWEEATHPKWSDPVDGERYNHVSDRGYWQGDEEREAAGF